MKLSELWRISRTIYKETSFQSIFSLRSGGLLPQRTNSDIKRLVRNAELNTMISKIIMSVFITVFGIMVFFPFGLRSSNLQVSEEMTVVGTVSAFLAVLMFLIVIMGLQVSTSFFSSKAVDFLSTLPLAKRDVSTVALLCFLRIFDMPLLLAVAGFPVAYVFFRGSVLGGLAALLSIGVTEVFALALTTGLAKFFYARIAGSSGRSKWKAFLRLVLMLVWILPSFGAYIVINFWMEIIQFFASFTQTVFALSYVIVVLYPFSYGFLVSYGTFIRGFSYTSLAFAVVSSLSYSVFAVYLVKWVGGTIRSIGAGGVFTVSKEMVKDTLIQPLSPWLGIIRKDLRIASRAPSYASIFLLPAIQTVILVFSFSWSGELGLTGTLGFLTGMSFMTVLIPPTLFSIEGLASAYTRSLPLQKRTLILSKTFLATLTYILSLLVIFITTSLLQKNSFLILTFGAVHILAVASANMLEILLLTEKFWKEGFALGNIFARLSTYILILIPGMILIFMPIFAAIVAALLYQNLVLQVFFVVACLEFLLIAAITLYMGRVGKAKPRF